MKEDTLHIFVVVRVSVSVVVTMTVIMIMSMTMVGVSKGSETDYVDQKSQYTDDQQFVQALKLVSFP